MPIPINMLSFRQNKFTSSLPPLRKEVKLKSGVKKEPAKVDRYKKKYKQIRRTVKELIFENAALCDQIAILQEKTLLLIEERGFLFKKLQQHSPLESENFRLPSISAINENSGKKPGTKKKSDKSTDSSDILKPRSHKKQTATKKKKIVKSFPTDAFGKPIFPIILGDFTVHSLGEICEKPEFYTDDIIYPIGYCSTRIYGSLKDPEKQCVYTCKILDSGSGPRFEIVPDADYDSPIVSMSIDQCHSLLLSQINTSLGTDVVNSKGRGADFFGLSHPTIHHFIQAMPGVRKCKGYIWTKFETAFQTNPNYEHVADEMEASLSYSALLRSILFSKSHLESMIKHDASTNFEDVNSFQNILL